MARKYGSTPNVGVSPRNSGGTADTHLYSHRIKVHGLVELRRMLKEGGVDVNAALRPAYVAVSKRGEVIARNAAPHKSGRMRDSIEAAPTATRARIRMGGRKAPHFFVQEFGGSVVWRSRKVKYSNRTKKWSGGSPVYFDGGFKTLSRNWIPLQPHVGNAAIGDWDTYHVLPALKRHRDEFAGMFMDALMGRMAKLGGRP